MLAAMADVVFVIDESGSEGFTIAQEWLADFIIGVDVNENGDRTDPDDALSFAEKLSDAGIDDVRYGLVGVGEGEPGNLDTARYAHSQLMTPGVNSSLFINPAGGDGILNTSDDVAPATFTDVFFNNTREAGNLRSEDGWDSLEHVIAEYKFRKDAVPLVVLVQADQGRSTLNDSLSHDGVLSALNSSNAIFNVLTAGQILADGEIFTDFITEDIQFLSGPGKNDPPLNPQPVASWSPIFDLTQYQVPGNSFSDEVYILGVEADATDGLSDGKHDYRWVDTDPTTNNEPTYTQSDTLQISHDGSNTGDTGMVSTDKSIVIGTNVSSGFGRTAAGYSTRSEPFAAIDMTTGALVHSNLSTALAPTGFSFDYFGTSYTSLWVNEDGILSFGSALADIDDDANIDLSFNANAPGSDLRPTQPVIAALWDDLEEAYINGANGRILYKTGDFDGDGGMDLAIQWTEYRYATDFGNDGKNDMIDFQAVLHGNGNIRINYIDIDSYGGVTSFTPDETTKNTGGVGSTVGLWNGQSDRLVHNYFDFVPGMHSLFTDFSGETADSYIRMAWDTGGAAWDIGVVDRFSGDGGIHSPEADALRDAVIESLADQILRADAAGDVYSDDLLADGDILLALNVGHVTADIDAGAAGEFRADDGDFTADAGATTNESSSTNNGIDIQSTNSIPAGTASSLESVFQSARGELSPDTIQEHISLRINQLDDGAGNTVAFPDGEYVVELYFAQPYSTETPAVFDVKLEGEIILNNYSVANDRSRIIPFGNGDELDSQTAGSFVGLVKRFQIDVTGGDGLQIDLEAQDLNRDPLLNAVRILRAQPDSPLKAPQVTDVILRSSDYSAEFGDFVYSSVVRSDSQMFSNNSQQIRTAPLGAVDELSIRFSRDVEVQEGGLNLTGMRTALKPALAVSNQFVYDPATHTATWRFAEPFDPDHYLISLNSVESAVHGVNLDGEWVNPISLSFGSGGTGYEYISEFPSGDGVPGGEFAYAFTVLPGDLNQDGKITSADATLVSQIVSLGPDSAIDTLADVNSDGVINTADNTYFTSTHLPEAYDLTRVYLQADFTSNAPSNGGEFVVDYADFDIFQTSYNSGQPVAPFTDGDMDGDGDVDGDDWTLFNNQLGLSFVGWKPLGPRR